MSEPYQPPKCRGDRHASWCGVCRVWVVSLWNHCRCARHLRLYEPIAARIRDLYGAEPGKPTYANACLLARRLIEKGVRFVQIFHESWDQHGNLKADLKSNCEVTDKSSAALVRDLKQRGLLDDTIVVWGGEFGRTPMVQGGDDGRDHHPNGFSYWVAGGGFKPGLTWGETDELGFNAVRDKVHVHDFHATLLHQLGFDHEKLIYRFNGRDYRLTDVFGEVVKGLVA